MLKNEGRVLCFNRESYFDMLATKYCGFRVFGKTGDFSNNIVTSAITDCYQKGYRLILLLLKYDKKSMG